MHCTLYRVQYSKLYTTVQCTVCTVHCHFCKDTREVTLYCPSLGHRILTWLGTGELHPASGSIRGLYCLVIQYSIALHSYFSCFCVLCAESTVCSVNGVQCVLCTLCTVCSVYCVLCVSCTVYCVQLVLCTVFPRQSTVKSQPNS